MHKARRRWAAQPAQPAVQGPRLCSASPRGSHESSTSSGLEGLLLALVLPPPPRSSCLHAAGASRRLAQLAPAGRRKGHEAAGGPPPGPSTWSPTLPIPAASLSSHVAHLISSFSAAWPSGVLLCSPAATFISGNCGPEEERTLGLGLGRRFGWCPSQPCAGSAACSCFATPLGLHQHCPPHSPLHPPSPFPLPHAPFR